jgi:DNA repair exonuclease SbcCD ATPase subunit
VNGQEVTNKYSAKDAAELKRKHPAAHQIYEKYSKNGPQIQIQAPIVIQGIPLAPALPGNRRSVDDKKLADQLEKISAQIEETQKLLEQLKEDPQQTEPLQKAIEQLKAARQAMQKTRRELDG